jgi:FkbM family methyltransferase
VSVVFIEGIGAFFIPSSPEVRRKDSELTVRGICGWVDREKSRAEGAWNDRCGQEYSHLGRRHVEDVRTVLDIGCNVGSFFVWACRIWWPDSILAVHAFDPGSTVIECARVNVRLVQRKIEVNIYHAAVTTDPNPMFREDVRTGCSRTFHGTDIEANAIVSLPGAPTKGVSVIGFHPRDLPAADAVKCDAEGVEGEILEHYPHWDGVKYAAFEWHEHAHRELMYRVLTDAGMRVAKNDCGVDSQGVAVWVR